MQYGELNALRESARNQELYRFDSVDAERLETFELASDALGVRTSGIVLECEEVTSLCPITQQPDFASVCISYIPNTRCVESKSLKLYLMGFRSFGAFAEQMAQRICADFTQRVQPAFVSVCVKFKSRGGITIHATASAETRD